MKKLKQLGTVLSKDQQKMIIGGYGECGSGSCSVYDSSSGSTYYGSCGWIDSGVGIAICECVTSLGWYTPQGGISHCYTM